MYRFLLILLIVSAYLIGCSSNNSNDDNSENTQESTWSKSVANLQVYSSVDVNADAKVAVIDKYCWEREEGDKCKITPRDPRDIAEDPNGDRTLFVKKGDIVSLHLDYLTQELPKPDEVFITQYTLKDEQGEQIEVILNDYNQPKITAPEEPGKYYYTVHFKWQEEAVGEAYYAFYFRVRDDS